MSSLDGARLADLRGLRSAPLLTESQRQLLRAELRQVLAACDWFTIGVMAPGVEQAWAALRSFEEALGWSPLDFSPSEPPERGEGPVFLKGHQGTSQVVVRKEAGLGEGVLITGHNPTHPAVEDTWGPFPLDFFGTLPPHGSDHGASSL